jgi:hypothetical protein
MVKNPAYRARLEHTRPGVLTWITPNGRSYSTEPTVYPQLVVLRVAADQEDRAQGEDRRRQG